jgi:2-oxoglutarate dehydrogenase complex dehydrogenase (E1) component-like enzyme
VPLVVLTPKSLLRAHHARSAVDELTAGSFRPVLDDDSVADSFADSVADSSQGSGADPSSVRQVVLASGKVAYDAMAARDQRGLAVPVLRVEQLYPWPDAALLAALDRYPAADEVVWLQEEPENMGPWPFVHVRLHAVLRDRAALRHVSRAPAPSPATGSQTVHALEQADLLERLFGVAGVSG